MKFSIGQVEIAINLRNTGRGLAVSVEASGPIGGLDFHASMDYQPETSYPFLLNIHLESEGQNAKEST